MTYQMPGEPMDEFDAKLHEKTRLRPLAIASTKIIYTAQQLYDMGILKVFRFGETEATDRWSDFAKSAFGLYSTGFSLVNWNLRLKLDELNLAETELLGHIAIRAQVIFMNDDGIEAAQEFDTALAIQVTPYPARDALQDSYSSVVRATGTWPGLGSQYVTMVLVDGATREEEGLDLMTVYPDKGGAKFGFLTTMPLNRITHEATLIMGENHDSGKQYCSYDIAPDLGSNPYDIPKTVDILAINIGVGKAKILQLDIALVMEPQLTTSWPE